MSVSPLRRRHPDHDPGQAPEAPDNEKLKRLLAGVFEALSQRSESNRREHIVPIRNFRSDRLELTEELIVALEEREGQYVATSYDTGQYGHGYSPDDAIEDLCSVIEDYYDLLLEDEERLSEQLKGHLRYLRSILRERK